MLEKQNTKKQLKRILRLLQYFVILSWLSNVYQNKAKFALQFTKLSGNLWKKKLFIAVQTTGRSNKLYFGEVYILWCFINTVHDMLFLCIALCIIYSYALLLNPFRWVFTLCRGAVLINSNLMFSSNYRKSLKLFFKKRN